MVRSNVTTFEGVNEKWLRRKTAVDYRKIRTGDTPPIRIADLFCGVGGMSLGALEGLKQAGILGEIAMAVDFSKPAMDVFRKNLGYISKNAFERDITELFQPDLATRANKAERLTREKTGTVDLLLAGPPCQGHSDLNNSSRRNDPRNLLYLSAIRAVHILKPKVAIIENVSSVVHDKFRVVEEAKAFLSKEYEPIEFRINAEDFGLAQSRKRHLLILVRRARGRDYNLNSPSCSPLTLEDVIGDLQSEPDQREGLFWTSSQVTPTNKERIDYLFENDRADLPDELRPSCHRDKKHSYVSMYGRLSWDKPAQTLTSGFGSMGQGRYVHPSKRRTLSPHEAARIQGFPDFFDFTPIKKRTELQTSIANAVPPQVIQYFIGEFVDKGWLR